MAEGSTKKDIQVSIGEDLSTVVIGGTRVEVGSDGKKVTAYTNDGVETRAAAAPGETAAKGTQISISADFNRNLVGIGKFVNDKKEIDGLKGHECRQCD